MTEDSGATLSAWFEIRLDSIPHPRLFRELAPNVEMDEDEQPAQRP